MRAALASWAPDVVLRPVLASWAPDVVLRPVLARMVMVVRLAM